MNASDQDGEPSRFTAATRDHMNPGDIAPMIVMTTLIIVTGGVILLRPLARRLGDLIDVMIADRRRAARPDAIASPADAERIVSAMESIDHRLRQLEERQDFTESLLRATRREVPPGTESAGSLRPPADTS